MNTTQARKQRAKPKQQSPSERLRRSTAAALTRDKASVRASFSKLAVDRVSRDLLEADEVEDPDVREAPATATDRDDRGAEPAASSESDR